MLKGTYYQMSEKMSQKEKNIFAENNQEETSLPEISEDDLVF